MKAVVALLVFASCASAFAAPAKHIVNFPEGTSTWQLVFPAPPAPSIFTDAMTAIEIEKVVCDGRQLEPEVHGTAHGPDTSIAKIDGASPIYRLTLGFFMSWIDPELLPSEARARRFQIAESTKTIEVTYRVRYPEGKKSDLLVVCFIATRDVTHRFRVRPPQ